MSASLWYAIETEAGGAACIHEMELHRSAVVLYSDTDSGRVREWAQQYNVRAAEERKRFLASQRDLFEDAP